MGQTNIVQGEYFIGDDPGFGAGTPLPGFTSTAEIDIDFTTSVSSLPFGIHSMSIRVMDDLGIWGIARTIPFFVTKSDALNLSNVAELEYFFGADPGFGLGTDIPISPSTILDIDHMISTASLPFGINTLSIRARSDVGEWSFVESIPIFVTSSDPLILSNIEALEYFFDSDPGIGSGVNLSFSAVQNLDISELISITALSKGLHTIYFRVRSDRGEWSFVDGLPFFIDESGGISKLEYFFDIDPGVGLANIIPISPSEDTLDIDLPLATGSLALGPHSLNVRTGNEVWGLTETVLFSICDGALSDFSADTVCLGDPMTFVDLSTNISAGDVYAWDFDTDGIEDNTNAGNVTFTYPSPGTFLATLRIDRGACPAYKQLIVVVEDPNAVTIDAGLDQTVCPDETVFLSATIVGDAASLMWGTSGDGTFSSPDESTSSYNFGVNDLDLGQVTLTLDGTIGTKCPSINDQMIIFIDQSVACTPIGGGGGGAIKVYNAVSPNGDSKHDFLEIENIESFPNNEVVIFNRWGDVVFEIQGYNNLESSFTGDNNKGNELPSGTYYYSVNLNDGSEVLRGFLVINR